MEAVVENKGSSALDGKFLTFVLGDEIYGIEILKAREIIGLMEITTVPQTPDYMKGVINLRGKVIPVIDLRMKFSMQENEHTKETCVIVVVVNDTSIGLIVDRVSEVADIDGAEIEDAPNFGQGIDSSFIMGLGKVKEKIIILLDIGAVISTAELEMVEELTEE
ncbi:MAG: chemotaxis protein CheW [Candidatus Scalindua sp.]|nr:chemotaxis protein CheW [Candidatus Scalindua sp.]